jgi:pilus assembly protein Flp/PilA
MKVFLVRLCCNIRGTTAIEYGLIASLIVIAALVALANVGNSTSNMWNNVSTKVSGA